MWRGVSVGVTQQGAWAGSTSRVDRSLLLGSSSSSAAAAAAAAAANDTPAGVAAAAVAAAPAAAAVDPVLAIPQQEAYWAHVVTPLFRPVTARALNVVRYFIERGAGEPAAAAAAAALPQLSSSATAVPEDGGSPGAAAAVLPPLPSTATAVPEEGGRPGAAAADPPTSKLVGTSAMAAQAFASCLRRAPQPLSPLAWSDAVASLFTDGFADARVGLFAVPALLEALPPTVDLTAGGPRDDDAGMGALRPIRALVRGPTGETARVRLAPAVGAAEAAAAASTGTLAIPSLSDRPADVLWGHRPLIAAALACGGADAASAAHAATCSWSPEARVNTHRSTAASSSDVLGLLVAAQHDLLGARRASLARLLRLLSRVQTSRQADAVVDELGLRIEDSVARGLAGAGCSDEPVATTSLLEELGAPAPPAYAVFPLGRNVLPWNMPQPPGGGAGSLAYTPRATAAAAARRGDTRSLPGALAGPRLAAAALPDVRRAGRYARILESLTLWRRVAASVAAGARDQRPGFTRQPDDSGGAMPASWLLAVDGRPAPPPPARSASTPAASASASSAAAAAADDAVCGVCFSWQAPEGNEIVYCDRCDVAVHRLCYGIAEVPEGEFFCDGCAAARASHTAPVAACALCPVDGGALKRTTCGLWVHVACALWVPGCWVTSLVDMGPIEIRPLHAAALRARAVTSFEGLAALLSTEEAAAPSSSASSSGGAAEASDDDYDADAVAAALQTAHGARLALPTPPCGVCGRSLGRTVRCAGVTSPPAVAAVALAVAPPADGAPPLPPPAQQQPTPCRDHVHPLCAWYAGLFLAAGGGAAPTSTSDSSFYAGGGAGLAFEVFCAAHSPAPPARSREQQRQVRAATRKVWVEGVAAKRDAAGKNAGTAARKKSGGSSSRVSAAAGGVAASSQRVTARPALPRVSASGGGASGSSSGGGFVLRDGGSVPVDAYPAGLCAVCFESSDGGVGGGAVSCVACSVVVHAKCYLGPAGAAAGLAAPFICSRCDALRSAARAPVPTEAAAARGLVRFAEPPFLDAQCCVCQRRGGALKPLHNRAAWSHLFCALQLPGTTFWTPDRFQGIDYGAVERRRWGAASGARCTFCGDGRGAHVECDECRTPFHALCAALAQRFFSWRRRADGAEGLEAYAFCARHAPAGMAWDSDARKWVADGPGAAANPALVRRLRDGGLPPEFEALAEERRAADVLKLIATLVQKRERLKRSLLATLGHGFALALEAECSGSGGDAAPGFPAEPLPLHHLSSGLPSDAGSSSSRRGAGVADPAASCGGSAPESITVRLHRLPGSADAWVAVPPLPSPRAAAVPPPPAAACGDCAGEEEAAPVGTDAPPEPHDGAVGEPASLAGAVAKAESMARPAAAAAAGVPVFSVPAPPRGERAAAPGGVASDRVVVRLRIADILGADGLACVLRARGLTEAEAGAARQVDMI